MNKKVLIDVVISAQNHTRNVAEKIANNLNADIFEIIPEDIYTSSDGFRFSSSASDDDIKNWTDTLEE